MNGNFPSDPVGKNLPSNAGDVGLILGQGTKIPRATTREPVCCNYRAHVLWSPHATTREKPTCHNERSRVPQLNPLQPKINK